MSRTEAFVLALLGLVLVVAGVAWLFGPWTLVAIGVGLSVFALLGAQIRE